MERLKWILGGYYLHDTRDVTNEFPSQAFPNNILINLFTTLENKAAFGQVSYKIRPQLEIEVGGRYTRASVDNPPDNRINIGPGVVTVNAGGHRSEDEWTGKVALNWTVNADNFIYAFFAKGYKAGGFDFGGIPFEPEVVYDHEIGWKSYFLDRRLRTQVGGFWNDYKNLQVSAINLASGTNALRNIGKSTIKGIEIQVEGQFGELRIDASGAYVNSNLGAISLVNNRLLPPPGAGNLGPQCGVGVVPPGCFNYSPYLVSVSGKANPYSPEFTFNAGLEYAFHVGEGSLTPRVNYSYVGEQWSTLIQAPLTDRLPSYGLWSASVAYDRGDWRVQAYGSNVGDKVYVAGHAGNNMATGAPRQYGVRVSRSF
jgi:iron complex outermembrane receptor protein